MQKDGDALICTMINVYNKSTRKITSASGFTHGSTPSKVVGIAIITTL